ncbi:hypothetical protein BKA67DRAFT_561869 [Truncatella angustata]|uniref:Uncharacterized protein n=1 Tax=Truncatella angustata TaxID=152316 RepID=A0A9P8ZY89_9PEZI|nr:uncharacterized protein BKA67DRAFT_561869 [Truncatella angustata]KAH6655791.1 hypothetical protein BKA67DRAFT_561869 [Truncatella angustata]
MFPILALIIASIAWRTRPPDPSLSWLPNLWCSVTPNWADSHFEAHRSIISSYCIRK